MPQRSRDSTYRIQVIERAIAILDCFLKESGGLTLADIGRRVDLHKSTLYRLLEVLRQHDLLRLDSGTGRYLLGVKMFQLGLAALGPLDLGRTAAAPMRALAAKTGENVNLGVLEGRHVVYVAKAQGRQQLTVLTQVGDRFPAYACALGKALLAFSSDEVLDRYLAKTELRPITGKTLKSISALRADLKRIRARGYSVDNEEAVVGVRALAAPIFDHAGAVVAAISLGAPASRLAKSRIAELAGYVTEAAEAISRALGWMNTHQEGTRHARGNRSGARPPDMKRSIRRGSPERGNHRATS